MFGKVGRTTIFMNTEGHIGDISEDCKLFLKAIKRQFTDGPLFCYTQDRS